MSIEEILDRVVNGTETQLRQELWDLGLKLLFVCGAISVLGDLWGFVSGTTEGIIFGYISIIASIAASVYAFLHLKEYSETGQWSEMKSKIILGLTGGQVLFLIVWAAMSTKDDAVPNLFAGIFGGIGMVWGAIACIFIPIYVLVKARQRRDAFWT